MPRKIGASYLCYQNWLGRQGVVQPLPENDNVQDLQQSIKEIKAILRDEEIE